MSTTKQNKTQVNVPASETANLFGQLFHDADGTTKSQTYSLAERQLQRKLQAAYDNGLSRVDELSQAILNERKKLSNLDINTINSYYAEIESTNKAMEYTAQEYNTLFGTELSK